MGAFYGSVKEVDYGHDLLQGLGGVETELIVGGLLEKPERPQEYIHYFLVKCLLFVFQLIVSS